MTKRQSKQRPDIRPLVSRGASTTDLALRVARVAAQLARERPGDCVQSIACDALALTKLGVGARKMRPDSDAYAKALSEVDAITKRYSAWSVPADKNPGGSLAVRFTSANGAGNAFELV